VTYEDRPDPSEVEVIFVSSDSDLSEFEEYYTEHPWAAVPFAADEREKLSTTFKVEGIPRVVVLSGADGSIVNDDARAVITKEKKLNGVF